MFVILFISLQSNGQHKVDSLKSIIEKSSQIDRFDPMISLVKEYAVTDNSRALDLAREARQIAYEFSDSSRIITSTRIIGQLLNRLAMAKEAEEILLPAIPIAMRNKLTSDYIVMLNNLALAYTIQAKYDKALQINFQALQLREQDNNKAEISISLNNIGLVYFKLRNYSKALEFYQKALQIKTEINDSYFLDRLYINIGLCYNQLKDFKKALDFFENGFQQCQQNCSDLIKIEGQFGLGVSYYGMGQLEKAFKHFNESLYLSKSINNQRFEAENLVYLGKIFISKVKLDSAESVLKKSEVLSNRGGYNELLIDTYRQFSLLYNKAKNFENAAIYQNRYISLKDSVYSERLIENIAKVQTDYAERKNLATIAAKEEVIQRQRSLNFAIIVIAVLSTLLIFVLFRSNRVKKKVNAALSEAKAIIEEQNKQLLNSNINLDKELKEKNIDLEKANESLRRVNEELDNFIYKTSHDIRGPLASLKGMCNVALLDVKDPVALGYLRKLDITAEKLNTILTRLVIVNQINNSILASERIDFNAIINDVLLLERKKGLPPDLSISKKVAPDIEFYSDKEFIRIILENLIDNAIKFYNDTGRVNPFVDITVDIQNDNLRVRVVDNGIGISQAHPDKIFQMFSRASERSETGGIGLYITKTAVQKLGGSINLKTTTEGHTEFFVMLPLSPAKVMA